MRDQLGVRRRPAAARDSAARSATGPRARCCRAAPRRDRRRASAAARASGCRGRRWRRGSAARSRRARRSCCAGAVRAAGAARARGCAACARASVARAGPAEPRLRRAVRASATPRPSSSAFSRISQRDGTVGTPSIFSARVSRRGCAPRSDVKSCAAWPISSSGEGRPSALRIGRLSQAPGSAASGHVPSLSEPRIMTSVCCRRASNGPQMERRGCTATRGRTFSPAMRLR